MDFTITGNTEVMAPAGSFESLMSAVKAGADSVYFGIEQLNMRARSSNNFTIDDLRKIASIAQEHGIKTYITINTVIYDHDVTLMRSIVDAAKAAGINAIIASDQAVLNYCRKIKMPVHISTQANISNIEAVEFYSPFADVMVLARELSLKQVAEITREIKRREVTGPSGDLVRIEIFVHGALCMAVSGKCYLSLHSNFASANRGACVQNCRRSYLVTDEEGNQFEIDNEYIMSSKDLCTIDFLDQVLEAGVSVLKIEGRGRSEDYVYITTECYNEAVNSIKEGSYTPEKIRYWKSKLETVYNRGFWDGYYLGKEMGEWSEEYGSKATKRKIYIGKGVKYFDKVKVGEFLLESHSLEVGDEIMISGPTTGLIQSVVKEIRINNDSANSAVKGDTISIPVEEKIRPSDKLYKVVGA